MRVFYITHDLNFKLGADIIASLPKTDRVAVLALLASGPEKAVLQGMGVQVIEFNFLSRFSGWRKVLWFCRQAIFLFQLAALRRRAAREIASFGADVVHTNLWVSDVVGIPAAKRAGVKRIISTQHDNVPIGIVPALLKRRALRGASCVAAISEAVREFTTRYFRVDESRIRVVYNGASVEYFSACRRDDKLWSGAIGAVGRLEPVKGHTVLLKALATLKQGGVEPRRVLVIGSGSALGHLKKFCKSAGLWVEFISLTRDLKPHLQQIDILVVPSLAEGLGVVVIEGLASQKLVIASRVGGIPELIKDGHTGLLFTTGNPEALKSKLLWALEHREEALRIRRHGFQWLMENRGRFDIAASAGRYRALYEEGLAEG